ncbi:MAG: 2,3-bisphosphoglycerate-dependent phosphoglycerate mutase [archaeon]
MVLKIVFVRHGESKLNSENRFCGWIDSSLSRLGEAQARTAAKNILSKKLKFDIAYSSVLKRSIDTSNIVLRKLNFKIPIVLDWRLNERCYGKLEGLNKKEASKIFGEKQVKLWRRGYSNRPPAFTKNDKLYLEMIKKYNYLKKQEIPKSESLKDTLERVLPFLKSDIIPQLKENKNIIIFGHGNSLRAIIKYFGKISSSKINKLELPVGVPIVCELDSNLKIKKHYFLADKDNINNQLTKERNQIKI